MAGLRLCRGGRYRDWPRGDRGAASGALGGGLGSDILGGVVHNAVRGEIDHHLHQLAAALWAHAGELKQVVGADAEHLGVFQAPHREVTVDAFDEGFTLREMGQVLGISYQRASELAAR